ncbi:MAG: hypoxanthine phosphoribosyltransferase, partial [SAR324 cluster bacterium]
MSTDSSLETEIDISKKEILISSSEINQRVAQLGKD